MKTKTALIIEDDSTNRAVMEDLLSLAGYETRTYESAASFLEKHTPTCGHPSHCPCYDLVLTDNRMPNMTGLEFLETLQFIGCKIPTGKKAIISGNWSPEEENAAKALGCTIFSKPEDMSNLVPWAESLA